MTRGTSRPITPRPLARTEVLGLFPELRVALDGLENFITETEMREMNYRVERPSTER